MGCCSSAPLETIDPSTIPSLPRGPVEGHVVEVIDGDTFEAVLLLPIGDALPGHGSCAPSALIKWRIRVAGIDAPELHPPRVRGGIQNLLLATEKLAAEKVRKYVASQILGRVLDIRLDSWDKYGGRVVGDVLFLDGTTLSQTLLIAGMVRPYSGEAKTNWEPAFLTRILDSREN